MMHYKSAQYELILSKFEPQPYPSKSGYGTIARVISFPKNRDKPKIGQQLLLLKYFWKYMKSPDALLKEIL